MGTEAGSLVCRMKHRSNRRFRARRVQGLGPVVRRVWSTGHARGLEHAVCRVESDRVEGDRVEHAVRRV